MRYYQKQQFIPLLQGFGVLKAKNSRIIMQKDFIYAITKIKLFHSANFFHKQKSEANKKQFHQVTENMNDIEQYA